MEIRNANVDDLDWLVVQAQAFAVFYGSRKSLVGDLDYSRNFIKGILENHYFRIAVDGETRLGFIAGMKMPHHFNPEIKLLHELFWWVPAEYRKTGAGSILLDDFIDYGKKNCDWISFTLEDNTPIKDDVLLKRGFKMKEKTYLMETN